MTEPSPTGSTRTPRTSGDQARAAIWRGILGAAKHLGKRVPLQAAPRPFVVQLREGNRKTPVYFIGNGLVEYNLAQSVSSDCAIFAVEIPWPAAWHDACARNLAEGLPTTEQMVASYVEAISAHRLSSRCVLAGYSFCGVMAFEAAHQLSPRGIQVETVILLDVAVTFPSLRDATWQKLREIWRHTSQPAVKNQSAESAAARLASSWSIIRWMIHAKIKGWTGGLVDAVKRPPPKLTVKLDDLGRPLHMPVLQRLYDNAMESYRPRRFDCRGVLFRAELRDEGPSWSLDMGLGWEGLFGQGLEVISVPGNHQTMMRDQRHLQALARELSVLLNRSFAAPAQGETGLPHRQRLADETV
jgi:thioesterase domain-containing protein